MAFHRVVDELIHGTRPVVTNLPIRLDRLNEHLQQQGHSVDVIRRVRLIDSEQIREWWRYRGRAPTDDGTIGEWVTLPEPVPKERRDNHDGVAGSTDFRTSPGPVLYCIDEIHTAFNARSWMDTGLAATWYLSQHRKLGDDVLMISQTPAQVDKQLRSLSQEWIHATNLGKLKYWQWFTLPRRILYRTYGNLPGPGEPIMYTGLLRIPSPGLADCYDTAQGNSIAGVSGADTRDRARGVPLLVGLPLAILVIIGAFMAVPRLIHGGVRMVADQGRGYAPPLPSLAPEAPSAAPAPASTAAVQVVTSPGPLPAVTPAALPYESTTVTGWYLIGRRLVVCLSDGSTLQSGIDLASWSPREGATDYDGRRYRLQSHVPPQVPQTQALTTQK